MPKSQINFGAAMLAALNFAACSSGSDTPRAEAASTAQTPSKTTNTGTNDPAIAAADRGRIAGDSAARIWVIIASDFECPFCRQWHSESYRQFVAEYVRSGKVKVAYINFPLGQHRNAVPAAQGAMCASAQNKFWQYHDALFESQDTWKRMPEMRPVLDSIARAVGVNFGQWSRCVNADQMLPLIFADRDRAASAGVASTPTFIVGKRVIAGAVPFAELKPYIDSAVATAGSPPTR